MKTQTFWQRMLPQFGWQRWLLAVVLCLAIASSVLRYLTPVGKWRVRLHLGCEHTNATWATIEKR